MACQCRQTALAMTPTDILRKLDPTHYVCSNLHAEEMVWVEKNCYVDVYIELIHALGLEPRAALPFVLALNFDVDQWTFFKPPHHDLDILYGIDVQELNVWRSLFDHALGHLDHGNLVSTEADAFWLPDTSGTDYRRNHVKTTIILTRVDPVARTADYFHNASLHRLSGDDFAQLFRLDAPYDPGFMPLYAEVVRLDRLQTTGTAELAKRSVELLRHHSHAIPRTNPVRRFETRVLADLEQMPGRGLDHFHAWSFATTRQLGAAFELASIYCGWLTEQDILPLGSSAAQFMVLSNSSKTLQMKIARAIATGKIPDLKPVFATIADAWNDGMSGLLNAL